MRKYSGSCVNGRGCEFDFVHGQSTRALYVHPLSAAKRDYCSSYLAATIHHSSDDIAAAFMPLFNSDLCTSLLSNFRRWHKKVAAVYQVGILLKVALDSKAYNIL
mmetsp:Transcript_14734/g.32018  ORF Transcript_14734/g.32018 Transcript_14734/m.32018 type:complete len:105 (-) Transcript_14734:38-352(-)